jgi:gas vesicle protein
MSNEKNNTGKKIAVGALLAGAVGYLTGILTAPKSGKQTREDIADKAVDIKESIEDQLIEINDELKKLISDSKSKTVALSSQAREEFNEAVVKAKDAQNKAATLIKSVKSGEAKDPELNKAIKQARQAAKNLKRYLKG